MNNLNPIFEHEFIWGVKTDKGTKKRKALAKILRAVRRGDDLNGTGKLASLGIAGGSAALSAGVGYATGGAAGAGTLATQSLLTSPFFYLGMGAHNSPAVRKAGDVVRRGAQYVPGLKQVANGIHDTITDNSKRARVYAKAIIGPEFINRRRRRKRNKELGIS